MDSDLKNNSENKSAELLVAQTSGKVAKGCGVMVFIVIIIVLFFVFGGKIFNYFRLGNIYNFIFSVLIIFACFIISFVIISIRFRNPKDIISMPEERFRVGE